VHAPAALAERIALQTRAPAVQQAQAALPRRRRFAAHWRSWAAAASAAAALIIAVPLIVYFTTPAPAIAALADIHHHNMSEAGDFVSETDPARLAAHFKEPLGFNPRLPEPNHGLALRGCCVRQFQGDIAGSYVVATRQGIMTVVVVRQTPQAMGITDCVQRNGQVYWKSAFALSNMVSVRIGEYSYCAVGEVSHNYLTDLLARLLD